MIKKYNCTSFDEKGASKLIEKITKEKIDNIKVEIDYAKSYPSLYSIQIFSCKLKNKYPQYSIEDEEGIILTNDNLPRFLKRYDIDLVDSYIREVKNKYMLNLITKQELM